MYTSIVHHGHHTGIWELPSFSNNLVGVSLWGSLLPGQLAEHLNPAIGMRKWQCNGKTAM